MASAIVRIFTVGTIVLLFSQHTFAEENKGVVHVVIEAATEDTLRSDTASMVELEDGALMVVYHKYERGKDAGNDHGVCRIWSKISRDGGLSWGVGRMLVDRLPGDLNVQAPALLMLPSGELLLACLRTHAGSASSTMCILRSSDGGETFVELSKVWSKSKGQWLQGGASSLVRLKSSRILLPVHGGTGNQFSQKNEAWCFISDDEGQTWQRSQGDVQLPMRGAMEASIAQIDGGNLRMSLRTQLGSVFVARSEDDGDTWSLAQTTGLSAPESCTCLRRIPGTNNLLLLFNNSPYKPRHHHYGDRSPLSAAISVDGGTSWRVIGNIADDPACEYTNLDCYFRSDGSAVVTYMRACPAFNRKAIDLCASIISKAWLER